MCTQVHEHIEFDIASFPVPLPSFSLLAVRKSSYAETCFMRGKVQVILSTCICNCFLVFFHVEEGAGGSLIPIVPRLSPNTQKTRKVTCTFPHFLYGGRGDPGNEAKLIWLS